VSDSAITSLFAAWQKSNQVKLILGTGALAATAVATRQVLKSKIYQKNIKPKRKHYDGQHYDGQPPSQTAEQILRQQPTFF